MEENAQLLRRLTLPYLVLYGLGTIVGAGIYVLVGKVAGRAGMLAPISFALAAALALTAAAAYAEMSSRFPKTAAETVFVRERLGIVPLAVVAGVCVLITGMVSSAALAVGFAGYFRRLVDLPHAVLVAGVLALLVGLAIWGIKESALASAVITCIEVGGLVLVVAAGAGELRHLPERLPELTPGLGATEWTGIVGGIFLAFFALIGFEDMVNVAEEFEDAPRTMPRAIAITMGLAIVLYIAVAVVATSLVGCVVLALALSIDVETLAQFTTVFTLSIVTLVNASLRRLKGRDPSPPPGGIALPRWLPGTGAVVSALFAVLTALDLAGRL